MMRTPIALAGLLALAGCDFDEVFDGEPRRVVGSVDLELSASTIDTLIVEQGDGTLSIVGSAEASEITAVVDLASGVEDEEFDAAAVGAMLVSLQDEGDGVARLIARFQSPQPGYGLPTTISVPRTLLLDVTDGAGELSIETVTGLILRDGSGDAAVSGIARDVVVDDGSGDLSITNVGGIVDVVDGSGDVTIEDVDTDVFLQDASGDATIATVDGDVSVVDDSGDLLLRDVAGHATISDGSGDIVLEGVSSWEILEDGSGDVFED